jgi:alpha-L-rhamnosidase
MSGRLVAMALALVAGVAVATPAQPAVAHTGEVIEAIAAPTVRVLDLRTEAQRQPLGIDVPRPRLSWRLASARRGAKQSSYRLVVTRSSPAARGDGAKVWDSGVVRSSRPFVDYAGPRLRPHTRYWWTVQLRDDRGARVAGTPVEWFETAFTHPRQWRAAWIGGPGRRTGCTAQRRCSPAPLLRREFRVRGAVASARLHASGLGYGTYRLNGRRVSQDVLSPGFTEYTERTLYRTYDVTRLLRPGPNAIGAELGRGPFGSEGDNYAGYSTAPWHAEPKLRLELHLRYADGRRQVIRSDRSWRSIAGPRLFDDYMLGETFDARRAQRLTGWSKAGFEDGSWGAARATDAPRGPLETQVEEPIRPQRRLPFKSVTRTASGTWLFDLGQDVTGNAVLRGDLPTGSELTLKYGERLDASGSVTTVGFSYDESSESGGGPMQLDTYIAGPGRDTWRPEFTFKGFRYVEVSGLRSRPRLSLLTAEVWRSDFHRTGAWKSSNGLVNRIMAASTRAIESNSLSIPMDTPIYEKTGYTADGQLVAGAASYLFDMRSFYAKWLVDIRQSVAPNGDMYISAPLPGDPPAQQGPTGFTHTSPGWDAALFVVPHVLSLFGGDQRPGRAALSDMQRVMAYYETRTRNDILVGRCNVAIVQVCDDGLGDWTSPPGTSSGAAVDSTAWYAWMLRRMAATARAAQRPAVASRAERRAEEVSQAFHRTFYDPVLGYYRDPFNPLPGELIRPGVPSTYSQHQNSVALGLGMVPADARSRVADSLAADIRSRNGHLNTGIMGTRFLFGALASGGHVDEAWAAVTQRTYPSYGYWLDELGYTSLGEYWEEGTRSHNHQMYASVVQWLFEDVAGYRPSAPGFAEIQVRPQVPSTGLSWVKAHTDTVRGRVATAWRRTAEGLVLTVQVPANATAVVHVPASRAGAVAETGLGRRTPAAQAAGVKLLRVTRGSVVYRIGSGSYRFEVAG